MSGRTHDTRTQAVKSLPARPHSAGRRVREEPRHTLTGGQISAGQTALGRSPSGRSHDTRSQAVKSLPARPHSAGRRVREEPRHTLTGGHIAAGQTAQVAVWLTGGQIPAGQTALGRSPCQGGAATHVHRRSNPCRPDRTRQVAVSGRSRDTRYTGGQIPAGQTALGRSPCQGGAATHAHRRSNPCRPDRTRQVAVSGRSRDTRTQAVKSLPARPHSAGRRVREEPRHTYTGGQIPAGQTALGRSPCQGGAATHVHRRSNPCRPDRTRQVAVSGRSRDTRTQAVKSLPARPHSAGRRVREEPRHTYTGGQIPAGQTALGRSPCQGGAATHGQIPAGQTALAQAHRRSNPCRPDRTRQVAVSGRSRDTRSNPCRPDRTGRSNATHLTGGQIPAGQTTLGRSPCQGGAATHLHRRSNPCRPDHTRQVAVSGRSRDTLTQAVKSLPARSHSAGRRVREEPRHTYTGGSLPARPHRSPCHYTGGQIPAGQTALGRSPCQGGAATHARSNPCRPDHTRQVTVSGRSRDTDTHVANPVGQITLIKYCKLTSLDASSSKELYITTTTTLS